MDTNNFESDYVFIDDNSSELLALIEETEFIKADPKATDDDQFFDQILMSEIDVPQTQIEDYILSFEPTDNILPVATSGGGGHITAIRSLIDKYYPSLPPIFKARPFNQKPYSIESFSIFAATHANYFTVIQGITQAAGLPVLPDSLKLARAIKQLESPNPRPYIDMLLDIYPVGFQSAAIWNVLQADGKVDELIKLIALQEKNDQFYYSIVKQYFYDILQKAFVNGMPYKSILNTQVVGIPAMTDAVSEYNKKYDQNVVIDLWMTDIFSHGAIHFLNILSKLSPKQQQQIHLYALNLNHIVLNSFFPQGCHFRKLYLISPKNNPMVRQGFYDYDNSGHFDTFLSVHPQELPPIEINASENIAAVMLGSQGSDDALVYVKSLAEKGFDTVFLFANTNTELIQKAQQMACMPKYLGKIKVLGNQNDQFIAQIMTRCLITIIRGGGLSTMEQLLMNHHPNKWILVHHPDSAQEELISGASWEDHNFEFMGIKLEIPVLKTSPSRIERQLDDFLDINSEKNPDTSITKKRLG